MNALANLFLAMLYVAGIVGLFIVLCYMVLLAIGFMGGGEDE